MGETITIKTKQVTINQGGDGNAVTAAKTRWDEQTLAGVLIKAEEERRFTEVLIYPADKADIAKAADGHRDFAGKRAVEDAAWNYVMKSRQVNAFHMDGTEGVGDLVESHIHRGPDRVEKAVDGTTVTVRDGDWIGGIRWSPQAWELVKKGLIRGVSPEGKAARRKPSAETVAGLRSE